MSLQSISPFLQVLEFLQDSIDLHVQQVNPNAPQMRSYDLIQVELDYQSFYLLLHRESKMIAFAIDKKNSNGSRFDFPEFIDHSLLTKIFENLYSEYRVLSKETLETPLSGNPTFLEHAFLQYASSYDLRYWQPRTYGQVLFNWWD
ncbi:hypothetical protein [Risungbinella massiliensis]|uniref:hypothetical protein n=1 Tax=Risungbinella massiliensis TaxID=1329796 RepID=UPI0005CBFFB2|nr:hypothetical protein [Risungbinella massiliensis]